MNEVIRKTTLTTPTKIKAVVEEGSAASFPTKIKANEMVDVDNLREELESLGKQGTRVYEELTRIRSEYADLEKRIEAAEADEKRKAQKAQRGKLHLLIDATGGAQLCRSWPDGERLSRYNHDSATVLNVRRTRCDVKFSSTGEEWNLSIDDIEPANRARALDP